MKGLLSVALMVVVCLVGMVTVSSVAIGGPIVGGNNNKCDLANLNFTTPGEKLNCMLEAIAEGLQIKPQRYYLTKGQFQGDEVLTACAPGFHMASLFEILTLSGIVYDTTLGQTTDDSGAGPPADISGWVRTGHNKESNNVFPPGQPNCNAWTSKSATGYGTDTTLSGHWTNSIIPFPIAPWWIPNNDNCNIPKNVWCVEDTK